MEENSLRLILLLVGIVILMGIYFYDVLQKKKNDEVEELNMPDRDERVEPVMNGESAFSAVFEDQQEASSVGQAEPEVLNADEAAPRLNKRIFQ